MSKNTNAAIDATTAKGRIDRIAAAKREHDALKTWMAEGKQGDRPATPNLDALNEEFAAGVRPKRKSSKSSGTARPGSVTEEEILVIINEMRAKDPSLKSASKVVAEIRGRGLAIGYPGGAIVKRILADAAPAAKAKAPAKTQPVAAEKPMKEKPVTKTADLDAARALAAKKAGRTGAPVKAAAAKKDVTPIVKKKTVARKSA